MTLLRNLTLYLSPRDALPVEVLDSLSLTLQGMSEGQAASDVGKKIYRTSCHLLLESIIKASSKSTVDTRLQSVIVEMFKLVHRAVEKIDDATSAKVLYSWRLLGSLVSVATCLRDDLVRDDLTAKVTSQLKALPFPEKKKASLFSQSGSTARYEKKLHQWTALFSCLRRTGKAPPDDSMDTVYMACASTHPALARHALAVLLATAALHPARVAQGILPKLREESQLLNFTDSACVSSIFAVCYAVSQKQQAAADVTDDLLMNIYEAILKLLHSRSTKISLEALKFLLSVPKAWVFTLDLLSRGTSVVEDCCRTLLRHLTMPAMYFKEGVQRRMGSLKASLSKTPAAANAKEPMGGGGGRLQVDSVFFPLVMRSCIRLGRFLVNRPEGVQLMATTRKPAASKTSRAAQNTAPVGRAMDQDQDEDEVDQLLDFDFDLPAAAAASGGAGSVAGNMAYMDAILKPLVKVLTGMIRHMSRTPGATDTLPHALADILKALVWTASDPLTAHADEAYEWLQEQLVSFAPCLGSDLALDILRNIAGRLRESKAASSLPLCQLLITVGERIMSIYPR